MSIVSCRRWGGSGAVVERWWGGERGLRGSLRLATSVLVLVYTIMVRGDLPIYRTTAELPLNYIDRYSLEWPNMAGGRDAGAVGGGAGGAPRERAARRQGSQRAGGRGGPSAGGAAGARRAADAGAGGGRAVRRARCGAHRGRGGAPAGRVQAGPVHAHHARDTPPPRARPHQLDEHVAAILKKLNTKRHHHHQPPVHDRETKAVPERGGVSERATRELGQREMRASRLTALLDIYVSFILTNINIIIIYF